MTIATGAPGTISSGTINQLPDWYTNYAKNITNLGTSLLGSLPGYSGYVDAMGNPAPMVAGLSDTQKSGISNVKSSVGSFQPGMNAAGGAVNSGITSVNGGLGQVAGATGAINNMGGALQQAQSFLNPAQAYAGRATDGSEYSAGNMARYMNPYTQGVNSEIARLANQNLTENVLPGVNSTFTGAGQFGSTRNGDFNARAIRDNQATISGAQAKVLADAQSQALDQAGAASNRDLQAGQQVGALSGLATNIASGFGNQAGTQIQQGNATMNGGQALGGLGQMLAGQAEQTHNMQLQDSQALLGAGMLEQNTNQAGLDAAYKDFMDRRDYPLQATGALGSLLGSVSSKVNPNTQTVQVNATQPTDKFQSISDLLAGMAYM